MKKKTHEQFISELLIKNKKLTLCEGEEYIGSHIKLKFECKHGHNVDVIPTDVLKGHGCNKCSKKPTKTHEKFIEEITRLKNITLKTGEIYKNSITKLNFICDHGHEWQARPTNILSGTGCPKCANKNVTIKDLIRKLETKNKTLTLVEGQEYINNYTKMKFVCSNGHVMMKEVSSALSGCGCAICSRKKKNTIHNLSEQLNALTPPKWLIPGQKYINNKTKMRVYCEYRHNWFATPKDLLNRQTGCPRCNNRSYSQLAIKWIKEMEISENIIIQHAENGGEYNIQGTKYFVDGYCTNTNTVYEFHGDAFHGNLKRFDMDEKCHPYDKNITAGELFEQTQIRINHIKSLGYNVIEMWENNF